MLSWIFLSSVNKKGSGPGGGGGIGIGDGAGTGAGLGGGGGGGTGLGSLLGGSAFGGLNINPHSVYWGN